VSFPRFLTNISRNPLLTLRMMLVNEGVKTGIYAGERVLSHVELTSPIVIDSLPPPLAQFLHENIHVQDHVYVLTWPEAKNLYDSLKAYASTKIILECEAIAGLITVERPKNFAIRWVYDDSQKCLERQLLHAERHLGKGWFQQDRYIWQLDNAISDITLKWISMYQIPERDVFWFVSHFIPSCQRAAWPFSSSLSILNNFALRLEIFKVLERSLDVQLVGNVAGVTEGLQYLDGDVENMISGDMLLPKLRLGMSDKLLELAHANIPIQIPGSDLPAFIEDDMRPHATQLGIDMGPIDEKIPVIRANILPLGWKLEHKMVYGIGQYHAIPSLGDFSLSALSTEIKNGERFYPINKGWIEFTPAFRSEFYTWDGINEFQLNPREILGFPSARLKLAQVQLPRVEVLQGSGDIEQITGFINSLKFHGLPGGFSGAQAGASGILVDQCQRLLKDYPTTSILWVVPQKKYPSVARALQQAHMSYTNAEFALVADKQVTLISPGASVELPRNWTLIILQDLDILAHSDTQIHFYSQLNRQWTLGTFTSDKWFEDTRYTPQMMLALQLVPENLRAFRETCVQSYPDQVISSRSKLIPSFKIVSSIDASAAIRIPPMPKLPGVLSTPPALPEPILPLVSASPEPKKEGFGAQARRYVNRVEPETASVPFTQYWPNYDAMTDIQQNWYFYWRSQVRQGNYLPADLSYLFVHVYEVLNLVGFASPQSAFDYLVKLWQQYRASQPNIDTYLVDWLADFAAIYKLRLTPLEWYNQARQQGATFGDFDLYIEAWGQSGGHFTDLSNKFLYRLAGYSPTNTKFYQEYNQDNHLDPAYKKGVQAVDDYLRHSGKSLIETYCSPQIRAIVREPFAGARYELDRKPVFIAKSHEWLANLKLPPILTSIIKYTENVLRTQENFKTMLLGAEVPKEWQVVIDHAFAPHREIEINTSKVMALKRESDEIRQRLIVDETQGFIQSTNDSSAHLTQLDQIMAILNDSHSVGVTLLRVLRDHDWVASETAFNSLIEQGHHLNTELDYLNKRAVKELGDTLIFTENGQFIVAQDYRDEIEYVLDHTERDEDTVSGAIAVVPSGEYTELAEAWAKFAQQMKPPHWEALAVLLTKVDVNTRLEAIARNMYSSASGLIDDINTFALDSIGDIVITTEGNIPHIEEEDVEGLQLLLAWANSKALLEKQV